MDPRDDVVLVAACVDVAGRQLGLADAAQPGDRLGDQRPPVDAERPLESALTQAATPGASINNINTTLSSLGKQLSDAINGASFNGLNILNGSQTSQLNFVAGFNATATGGTPNRTVTTDAVAVRSGIGCPVNVIDAGA